jgi:hypothetical protein
MIAVHFENLLFLLFVAGAFLFQLLARAASKTSKNADESQRRSRSRPQAPPPIPRVPAETDEERIRKFLEALGQPTTSKPPPPIIPRPTYQKPVVLPHAPPFASPLPPLTTRPPAEPPRRVTLPRQITHPPYETKSFQPTVAEPAVFEVQEAAATTEPPRLITTAAAAYAAATQQKVTPEGREKGIVALLKSPSGLREAIVLREIFAPPLSLRAIDSDLIGSA